MGSQTDISTERVGVIPRRYLRLVPDLPEIRLIFVGLTQLALQSPPSLGKWCPVVRIDRAAQQDSLDHERCVLPASLSLPAAPGHVINTKTDVGIPNTATAKIRRLWVLLSHFSFRACHLPTLHAWCGLKRGTSSCVYIYTGQTRVQSF